MADMMQFQKVLEIRTAGAQFLDITRQVAGEIEGHQVGTGVVTIFVRHTSASLTIQENADPSVLADLSHTLQTLAPEDANYLHNSEGPDDMPAHVKSALTATSLSIPLQDGAMLLGTWQGIYLWEHRHRRGGREVVVNVLTSAS